MKTVARSRIAHVLGLALALMGLITDPAAAQQSIEVPPPVNQATTAPPLRPRASATPPFGSSIETLPQVRQAPPATPPPPPAIRFVPPPFVFQPPPPRPAPLVTPAPYQPPPLPAVFRGCWEGRVDYLDSIERLPDAPKTGPWTAKTYRLCYRRTSNGPFELTFTDAGIEHSHRITNAEGKMQVLSTDGRSFASLRALLHFDEYRVHSSYFGGNTFPVDELTNLDCRIAPDGMHVRGKVYGERSGKPWFRATWHTVFQHAGDLPPIPE